MKLQIEKIPVMLVLLYYVSLKEINGCEVLETKAPKFVYQRRLVKVGWSHKWTTYLDTELRTLYYYVVCKNASLEIGQPLFLNLTKNRDLKYIVFQNSTIHTIPEGVFLSFGNTTELYLNSSKIEYIQPGAFNGLNKLEELHLQDNNIHLIESGTVNYLSKLKVLDLSNNGLKIIEKNSFLGLQMLQKLYLNINKLGSDGVRHFKSLQNLVYVDASQNYIDFINFNNFPENLSFVNFSANKINYAGSWSSLENVTQIDMSNNQIQSIGKIGESVKFLYLRNNKLKYFNSTFDRMSNLIVLDLSHNLIYNITGLFKHLTKLQNLCLNSNLIKTVPIGCFTSLKSLKYLDLSKNLITNLTFGVFSGLINLEKLSLAQNQIAVLPENSLYVLSSLRHFDMSSNSLRSLAIQDLLEHFQHLETISLGNNRWECSSIFEMAKVLKDKKVALIVDDFETTSVYGVKCSYGEMMVDPIRASSKAQNVDANNKTSADHLGVNNYSENIIVIDTKPTSLQNVHSSEFTKHSSDDLLHYIQNFLIKITSFLTIISTMCLVLVLLLFFISIRLIKMKYFNKRHSQHVGVIELH